MPSTVKIIGLISQLTKATVKGTVKWHTETLPDLLARGTNDEYPLYFETVYRDQTIGIALRRFQQYDGDRDRFFWNEKIVLMFIDGQGRVLWETDLQSSGLQSLFEVVREDVADVDGILSHLLSDENEDDDSK